MALTARMHTLWLPLSHAVLLLTLGFPGSTSYAAELFSSTEAAAPEPQASESESLPLVDRSLLLGFLAGNNDLTLIDARSAEEFADQHISGAINVPHDQLSDHQAALPAKMDTPLVVYCRTGRRAGLLLEQLQQLGYTDVQVLPARQVFWGKEALALNCGITEEPESSVAYPLQSDTRAKPESVAPAPTNTNTTRERG